MKRSKQMNLTEGIIWKQMLLFFLPILLGTFFQQFYNTVDTVIVGRFVGKNALAAVGGSVAIIQRLITGVFIGVTTGASVIISHYEGQNDLERLDKGIHTIYAFSLAGGIVMMVLCLVMAPTLLVWMRTPSELMADSILYLRIYFAGIIFVFIYNAGSAILRAIGDSRRPLYYLIVCAVINIVLDLVFVIVFDMGVAGAALATVAAQVVSSLLVTKALMGSAGLSLRKIRLHKDVLKRELAIGIPDGVQYAMYDLPNMVVQAALNSFGTNTVAAWAAYGKIDAVFWMVSSSVGATITTFAGQNYGAGKMERMGKGIRFSMVLYLVPGGILSALMYFCSAELLHVFTGDLDVIRIGTEMMRVISPWYVSYLFVEVFSGALRGMGDVMIPLIMTVFGVGVVRVLWVLISEQLHASMAFTVFTYPVTWVFTAVLFTVYFIYRIHPGYKR